MRRHFPTFIPIVLIAVLAQFLAPIGAFRAVADALANPLAAASICSGMVLPDAGQPLQHDQAHADCCAVCVAGHSVLYALDTPESRLIGPLLEISQSVWHQANDVLPAMRWRSPAQARGPPVPV